MVVKNKQTIILPVKTYAYSDSLNLEALVESLHGTSLVEIGIRTFKISVNNEIFTVKIIITRVNPSCHNNTQDTAYLLEEWPKLTHEWLRKVAIILFEILFEINGSDIQEPFMVNIADNEDYQSHLLKNLRYFETYYLTN